MGERFLTLRSLPAAEMTGVSREKGGGGEMAAKPPSHHLSYHQWHGVISNGAKRNEKSLMRQLELHPFFFNKRVHLASLRALPFSRRFVYF